MGCSMVDSVIHLFQLGPFPPSSDWELGQNSNAHSGVGPVDECDGPATRKGDAKTAHSQKQANSKLAWLSRQLMQSKNQKGLKQRTNILPCMNGSTTAVGYYHVTY